MTLHTIHLEFNLICVLSSLEQTIRRLKLLV